MMWLISASATILATDEAVMSMDEAAEVSCARSEARRWHLRPPGASSGLRIITVSMFGSVRSDLTVSRWPGAPPQALTASPQQQRCGLPHTCRWIADVPALESAAGPVKASRRVDRADESWQRRHVHLSGDGWLQLLAGAEWASGLLHVSVSLVHPGVTANLVVARVDRVSSCLIQWSSLRILNWAPHGTGQRRSAVPRGHCTRVAGTCMPRNALHMLPLMHHGPPWGSRSCGAGVYVGCGRLEAEWGCPHPPVRLPVCLRRLAPRRQLCMMSTTQNTR